MYSNLFPFGMKLCGNQSRAFEMVNKQASSKREGKNCKVILGDICVVSK